MKRDSNGKTSGTRGRALGLVVGVLLQVGAVAGTTEGKNPAEDRRGFLDAELQAEGNRARVMSVVPGGPADRAGLAKGDVIEAFNGTRFQFSSDRELFEGLAWIRAGRAVKLTLSRKERRLDLAVIPRAATEKELEALGRWIEQAKRFEEQSRRNRAESDFEAMVRQAPIDVTLRRTANGVETTSRTLLPAGLDLRNAFVDALTDALRGNDQVTIHYTWDNAINALRIDVSDKPSYLDVAGILERVTAGQRRQAPTPPR